MKTRIEVVPQEDGTDLLWVAFEDVEGESQYYALPYTILEDLAETYGFSDVTGEVVAQRWLRDTIENNKANKNKSQKKQAMVGELNRMKLPDKLAALPIRGRRGRP